MSKDQDISNDPIAQIKKLKKTRKLIENLLSQDFDPYRAVLNKVEEILKEVLEESESLPKTTSKHAWVLKEFMKRYDEKIMGIVR